MKTNTSILVFGEAIFDCFPDGEQVLGGAPFNVAWHLQALGDKPVFISRIGNDKLGQIISSAIHDWGMSTQALQIDPAHPTGQVEVTLIDNEPCYAITPNCAYDFISAEALESLPDSGILYHGTLGLRNSQSRDCLASISHQPDLSIFLDVNLRSPWWQQQEVFSWLEQARWAKLNEGELQQLGFAATDIEAAMHTIQAQFQLEQLIVTQGAKGVSVLTNDGALYQQTPSPVERIVDTVGAGDGFSAMYMHGLRAAWPIQETMTVAQKFAGKVIGLRGATAKEQDFYRDFI